TVEYPSFACPLIKRLLYLLVRDERELDNFIVWIAGHLLPPAAEDFGGFLCVVGDYYVCPGPLYAGQYLHHHELLVYPSELPGGLDHRILAAHVIGGQRVVELLARGAYDVQVRERRLHH